MLYNKYVKKYKMIKMKNNLTFIDIYLKNQYNLSMINVVTDYLN